MPSKTPSTKASTTAADADIADDAATTPSGAMGSVHLEPIEGSVDRSTITVELALQRDDGVLVLGDLRLGAVKAEADGRYEAAHRLWSTVIEAAKRLNDDDLTTAATAKADGVRLQLLDRDGARGADGRRIKDDTGERRRTSDFGATDAAGGTDLATPEIERRRGVSYDYQSLADDRASGLTQVVVAERWGCSVGTVARAERYVRERDALGEVADYEPDIHSGTSVAVMAERYEVSTKVMRWIVSDYWDRRG